MKLTKREVALNQAKEQGERDFYSHSSMPDYNGDKGLEQAWNQGWVLAQRDYYSFYGSDGYY